MDIARPIIIDDDFLQRVLKTSLWVSLFIIMCSFAYRDSSMTAGLFLGACISLVFFALLCWTVKKIFNFKQNREKTPFFAIKITLIKFPVLGVILYYSLSRIDINPFSLIAGISIVQVVMILKVIGMLFTNRMNSLAKIRG
ncbi:MAG: ATP synthase subunit I [Nitrospinota bacterium]